MVLVEYAENKLGFKSIDSELFFFKETFGDGIEEYSSFKISDENESFVPILISKKEMPFKNDKILVEQLDGNFIIDIAKKNLSNKDLYSGSERKVFKIISYDLGNENLQNIKNKTWLEGNKFMVEIEDRLYKENEKEVDYILYDSSKTFFRIKEPLHLIKIY